MQSIDTTATATGVLTARRTTLAEAIEAARAYASGEADSVPPCIGRALVAFALETASDLARGSEVSLATAIAAHVYGTGALEIPEDLTPVFDDEAEEEEENERETADEATGGLAL